jgi:hypothetical protein
MATVNKDFKIKHGLVVEGASGTINGFDILTESQASQDFIVGIVGGETLVKSVSNEFDVSAGGELSIDRTTVDAYYDAAGDAAAVAGDLTDHENATEAHGATGAVVGTTNTQTLTNKTISYTDNTLTVQVANVSDLTASASELNTLDGITASTEELNLLDGVTATTTELNYVDGVTSAIQDQLNAKAPLDAPALTGIPTAPTAAPGTNSTQIATTAYADAAVAALVDGAPELLDTLNELAAAINDDANFASTLTTSVGEKVSKSGDTMTGLLVLSADPSENLGAATKQYVDTAETDAVATAESYTDGEITTALATAQGYANTAEDNAIAHADALTTDDVAEGTTQYFTDARAKTSAADLLTGASLTNITITGDGTGLVITAENGVADSDTDDLTEGTTNLYFTDARAVDALEAVVPNFTAVEINSVAKQVAATLEAATAGIQVAHAFAKAEYRSAEYLVKVAYGTHTEISKVLLTLDTSDNIAITEYGIVGTNGSASTISAGISGTDVQLQVTTTNNDSTVTVMGTLLV